MIKMIKMIKELINKRNEPVRYNTGTPLFWKMVKEEKESRNYATKAVQQMTAKDILQYFEDSKRELEIIEGRVLQLEEEAREINEWLKKKDI